VEKKQQGMSMVFIRRLLRLLFVYRISLCWRSWNALLGFGLFLCLFFLVFWQAEYTPCTLVPLRLLDGIRLHLDVFTKLNEPFSSGDHSCTALSSTQISICAHIGDMTSA
jgi:hypothetical protein